MSQTSPITAAKAIHGSPLPNIPWEDRPQGGCGRLALQRNPIIPRDLIPSSNSIFNSAVVPFKGAFAGVFRCDNKTRDDEPAPRLQRDGFNWTLDNEPHRVAVRRSRDRHFQYRYDPRVVWLEDRYYVTWCNGYHGPTIGIGYTYDFETFHSAGKRLPALQPQRRALPAQDQRQVRHAQPAQRQRPHPLRRHLPQPKPRHGPLGPAPLRDGHRAAAGRAPRSAPARSPSRPPKAGCCSTTAC